MKGRDFYNAYVMFIDIPPTFPSNGYVRGLFVNSVTSSFRHLAADVLLWSVSFK
jgi:hypothetical protein